MTELGLGFLVRLRKMGATTNREDIYKSNKVYESLSLLT